MKFQLRLTPSAGDDLDFFAPREQKIILDAVESFLGSDADIESRRRKRLRPNPLAPWALRIGDYRVFYEIGIEQVVTILVIGHKAHNELFVRGRRVEI